MVCAPGGVLETSKTAPCGRDEEQLYSAPPGRELIRTGERARKVSAIRVCERPCTPMVYTVSPRLPGKTV